MADQQHPIIPPPELVQQLRAKAPHGIRDAGVTRELHLIAAAYAAGADQELKACCEALSSGTRLQRSSATIELALLAEWLRAVRRPSAPSSLKKLAYDALDTYIYGNLNPRDKENAYNTICRALESLPD